MREKIVIKIGGALNVKHGVPRLPTIESYVKQIWEISQIMDAFFTFVLSGAIPIGFRLSREKEMDMSPSGQSAYSMAGQTTLFDAYERVLRTYGFLPCSGTYTTKTLQNQHTLDVFQKNDQKKAVVLMNEADNVNPEEVDGDNDPLAAKTAVLIKADHLILLSTINDGIECSSDLAKKMRLIKKTLKTIKAELLTYEFIKLIDNGKTSRKDSKGIGVKLQSARLACEGDVKKVTIANGLEENILKKILLEEKEVGTTIVP